MIELLKLILPELLLEHYHLVLKVQQEKMHLFFEEKNTLPKSITTVNLSQRIAK
jgi:hypothetical protein